MKKYVMVRKKYLVRDGIYHVIQRAPGDELLFKDNDDRHIFIYMMKSLLPKFNINILAYALMPNHLHILLKIKELNLSKCMKQLFERYASYFNNKYHRKGHVFYGVYRAVYCDNPFAILVVSFYIHLNAFKANLASNPFEYEWHSLNQYIGKGKDGFVMPQYVLSIINDNNAKAKKSYRKLMGKLSSFSYQSLIKKREALSTFYDECSKKIKFKDFF